MRMRVSQLVDSLERPSWHILYAVVELNGVSSIFEALYDDKISSLVSQHWVIAPGEMDAKDREGLHPRPCAWPGLK